VEPAVLPPPDAMADIAMAIAIDHLGGATALITVPTMPDGDGAAGVGGVVVGICAADVGSRRAPPVTEQRPLSHLFQMTALVSNRETSDERVGKRSLRNRHERSRYDTHTCC
jgi:hypothetical protein